MKRKQKNIKIKKIEEGKRIVKTDQIKTQQMNKTICNQNRNLTLLFLN